jgi:hypothetical protein
MFGALSAGLPQHKGIKMKVHELIEMLKQQPQNADIMFEVPELEYMSLKLSVFSFPPENVVYIKPDDSENEE